MRCKHSNTPAFRDSRGAFPVVYHWRGRHCPIVENTVNAATNNTRCN